MWDHAQTKINYLVRRKTFAEWEIRPRFIHDYELVLVVKGRGYIQIAEKTSCVKAGDLICFRPGIEHSLWVTEEPYMEFYAMHFEIPPEAEPLSFPDLFRLDIPVRLESLFRAIHSVHLEKGYLYEWKQSLLFQQIICEIYTVLHEKKEPMRILRVRKALEYIHEDPCRQITLDDLIARAGIRKTVFMQSFRTVTGTTPIQYLIGQRLESSRELLLDSGLSVAQIAEKCGFSDAFYFSRCFKKHFSVSPKQYREMHRV